MIKLLYITNGISKSGGLERVLSIKASYLADHKDYEVHIITLNEETTNRFYHFSPRIIFHNITVKRSKVHYLPSYIKGIKRKVSEIDPDIISVCDDGLKGFFLPQILRKPKRPVIYERHASIDLEISQGGIPAKIKKHCMRLLSGRFDAFIVLTSGNAGEWSRGNIKVIPNPVSMSFAEEAVLTNKTAIAVGTHTHNKGYDLLINAWEEIVKAHPDWKLYIYGRKDKNGTYEKLTREKKLEKNILFFDPVQNIEEAYLNSSLLVLSSRSEGFGMVLIEAMACGVPCVSFNCPSGPADIIQNEKDGFIVENGNVKQLIEKINYLMDNEAVRKSMGKEAKKNAKKYQPANIIEIWDNLFTNLLTTKL